MESFFKILKEIGDKPKQFLGRKSLELLNAFLNGYVICQYETYGVMNDYLTDFEDYIKQKHSLNTDHNCFSIIRFFCSSDEEAFDEFYQLLDDFYNLKNE